MNKFYVKLSQYSLINKEKWLWFHFVYIIYTNIIYRAYIYIYQTESIWGIRIHDIRNVSYFLFYLIFCSIFIFRQY